MGFLNQYHFLHEKVLEQKFSTNVLFIQNQIESERILRKLTKEQLDNQLYKKEKSQLLSLIFLLIIISLIVGFILFIYFFKRKKEKEQLLTTIKAHRQQLFLLTNHEVDDDSMPIIDKTQSLPELLVGSMVDAISIWEKSTSTNKIEFADRSGIWTVSIDDGRLRTRSMNKYLNIKKLPKYPRWKNVVKTCHYILAECHLSVSDRRLLTRRLDSIMYVIKKDSLGK